MYLSQISTSRCEFFRVLI